MDDFKPNRVFRTSVKLAPDVAEWVYAEQERIRKNSGKRPTVSEVLRAVMSTSNSNAVNAESTDALVPALLPTPLETRYVDPELLALQELTARAWRTQKGDELAKTIVSLLRIYGDIARNITLEGETS